jgi:hypothetical protein
VRRALAIFALAGCGHHDATPPAPTPAPPVHIDAAAPIAIAPPPDAAPPDPFAGLFAKGPPRPPGPLAALPLDATLADARRAAPALFTENGAASPAWPGVTFRADVVVDQRDRPVQYLGTSISFPTGTNARDALERAWGPGADATNDAGDAVVVWFDPATGVRAALDDTNLQFRHYLPLAKLLGDGRDLAVGPTPDALRAAHGPGLHENGPEASLPPTDWDFSDGFMTVQSTGQVDGHVSFYILYIAYKSRPAARDEILAAFERKWGKGKPIDGGLRFVDGPIEVIAHDDHGAEWVLEVTDRALFAKGQAP